MARENIRQWTVGDVRITRIVEVARHPAPVGMLLAGEGPELFEPYRDWLHPHFIDDEGNILMQWQAFALQTPTRTMMVDTCIGNDRRTLHFDVFNNLQTEFLADLRHAGIDPDAVDTVACTHLHYDHVGWNTRWDGQHFVPTFPNARYLIDRTDHAEMRALEAEGDWHANHLPEAIDPIIAAGLHDFIDAPDHRICEEMWFEHTPGHTAGHCAIHIASRGERAVITGDLMHHPVQCAIPDRHGAFDHDPATGSMTRRRFVEEHGDGSVMVIGSHFADPTAGWIVPDGDAWRFVIDKPA